MLQRLPLSLIAGAALALAGAAAQAESQYGYATTAGAQVSAQARVDLKVSVPKLILLRVGSTNGTIDELSWTASFSIPGVPTAPTAAGTYQVDWNGTAPAASISANPAAPSVYAWTNASSASLNYAATNFGAGGPALSDIAVSAGPGLAHPGPATLTTGGTSVALTRNTLHSGSWTYELSGTAANWQAGDYTAHVTYTATGV